MKTLFVIVATIVVAVSAFDAFHHTGLGFVPPHYNKTVWEAFRNKTLLNPMPALESNPYDWGINTTWVDTVCAVKYPNPNDRSKYMLVNYTDPAAAHADGAFVTHLHPCGYCSTTRDLSVYMEYPDLTNPVRDCALETFINMDMAVKCLSKIGFTPMCSKIWLYDAMNTRKDCLGVCLKALIDHTPNNVPPGSDILNPCLECDEVKSGPIFKLIAGRTRRDSGLHSNINRPNSSIYPITHYYY